MINVFSNRIILLANEKHMTIRFWYHILIATALHPTSSIAVATELFLATYPEVIESQPKQSTWNIKDFGAVGNGIQDDTKAIQSCINSMVKAGGSVILFPYGNYSISAPLEINASKLTTLTIKGISNNKKNKPVISSSQFITLLAVTAKISDASQCNLTIENLEIRGNNPPKTNSHPYLDKWNYKVGLLVSNLRSATIRDNIVRNVYGYGIQVYYSNAFSSKNQDERFSQVIVKNNVVLNCWGWQPSKDKNGTYDNYGDGIYINSTKKGIISGNQIKNNLFETNQIGRAGITLESNAENCNVSNNYIYGYDRNIHLELDLGGHLISNNRLEGSDCGILLYNTPVQGKGKPVTITNNVISNKGFKLKGGQESVNDKKGRAMFRFFAADNCRAGSVVSGNKFDVLPEYYFVGTLLVDVDASKIDISNNVFNNTISTENTPNIAKSNSRPLKIQIRKTLKNFVRNTFTNVDIDFATGRSPQVSGINKENKQLGKGKSNIRLN